MFSISQPEHLTLHKQSPEVFCKNGVVRNFPKFTGKHQCQSLFFNKVAGFSLQLYQKKTLAQVLSCELCEISNSTSSYRTPPVAASYTSNPVKKRKGKNTYGNLKNFHCRIFLALPQFSGNPRNHHKLLSLLEEM